MAQTGYTPISIYYSATSTNVPTAGNLVAGELAINTADGKLFYKDSSGVVQVIGTKGGVGSSTTTQVLYNSSGLVVGSANMTFDGTKLTLANDASISGLTVGKGGNSVSGNTAVGQAALAGPNSGYAQNSAFGYQALNANTTGYQNSAFGGTNSVFTTTGANNSAFGYGAFYANTTGSSNTALGTYALNANTTASYNTAVGYQAGYNLNGSGPLTAIGYQAGSGVTSGNYNSFLGYQAGSGTTTTSYNTGIGHGALQGTNTGGINTAVGFNALSVVTSGQECAGFGVGTLGSNTTGSYNSAYGRSALQANTTGASNTAMGKDALINNTTASNNTAVGYQAGYSNTTAPDNAFFGYQAGYSSTTNGGNTAIGNLALQANTSYQNTAVGSNALLALTTGNNNTVIGKGSGSAITTASNSTIIGCFSGNQGGLDIRTASNYIVLSDGAGNPRGWFNNNGSYFVATPGLVNTASNTVNGCNLDPAGKAWFARIDSNNTVLGIQSLSTGTSTMIEFDKGSSIVGSITSTSTVTAYNVTSDRRLKENIAPLTNGLSSILALKPSQYNYIADPSTQIQGFIADELQAVVPHAVTGEANAVDAEGKPVYQAVDSSFLIPHLVAAIQEQQAIIEQLKAKVGL